MMDYKKHYNLLINSRKDRILKVDEYYESHHIIPKCIGGDNPNHNLVKLTAREHYVAHWLLTKIYKNSWKIYSAFFQMSKMNNKNGRIISSTQYERAKKCMSIAAKLRLKDPNYIHPGKTEKSRAVARERFRSDLNPMIVYPEKNHTAKRVTVEYDSGEIKIFKMKKELALELKTTTDLTDSAIKRRINKNDLQEYGYKNITLEQKQTKPGEASVGRKWYTNGKENEFVFPGTESEGFVRGITRKNHWDSRR